jgi:hypothetical protein
LNPSHGCVALVTEPVETALTSTGGRAAKDDGLLDATADELGASVRWEDIHKVKPLAPLTCRACTAPMTARVSSRGLRHFAHRAAASDCPTLGETIHHHLLKIEGRRCPGALFRIALAILDEQ